MSEVKSKNSFKDFVNKVGLPTLIIACFWVITLISGAALGISTATLISDTLKRAGMNGILVLAMVPSIQSGTGPNFALPIGVVCGLFALVCSIELGFMGVSWLVVAFLIAKIGRAHV